MTTTTEQAAREQAAYLARQKELRQQAQQPKEQKK